MTYRWKVKYYSCQLDTTFTGFVRAKTLEEAVKKAELKFDPMGYGIKIESIL